MRALYTIVGAALYCAVTQGPGKSDNLFIYDHGDRNAWRVIVYECGGDRYADRRHSERSSRSCSQY